MFERTASRAGDEVEGSEAGAVVVIQETGHGCEQEWWAADWPEEIDTRDRKRWNWSSQAAS